jgi:hypothetical protein
LSRACLGKKIVCMYKWLKRPFSLTVEGQHPRAVVLLHLPTMY